MAIQIYNTLKRKKEELKEKKIGIYVCGPTVYDEPHIGHARSAYIFDVIVRYIRYRKLKVTFVRNVTDIDDKIIDRARRESGSTDLKDKVKKVADKYLARYHEDMERLGLLAPDIEPRATETIKDMIKFIQVLIKRNYAYEASGSVYFDVRKFKAYGELSRRSPGEMLEGARVAVDQMKRNPLDFALWKKSKDDEPSWPSPWSEGRPGWHIECSVMSTKYLKNNFLIHGGGLDLIFPHHENEIAQTVCAGRKSARYWVHNGLLTIESQKMAKSLGNFVTVEGFLNKFKDQDLLKLFFLDTHYRSPVDYTEEKIQEMKRAKERISIFLQKVKERREIKNKKSKIKNTNQKLKIAPLKKEFILAMDDDFNTPKALAAIFDLVALGNANLSEGGLRCARYIERLIRELLSLLGLSLKEASSVEPEVKREIEKLIKERNEARANKNFDKADKIRSELLKQLIILEDTPEGTVWRKKRS